LCDQLKWIIARYRFLLWRQHHWRGGAGGWGGGDAVDVLGPWIEGTGEVWDDLTGLFPKGTSNIGHELQTLRLRAQTIKAEMNRLAAIITSQGGAVPPCPELTQTLRGGVLQPGSPAPPPAGAPP